jgi:hypothetical protein
VHVIDGGFGFDGVGALLLNAQGLAEPLLGGVVVVMLAGEGLADLVMHDGGEELV